MAESPSELQQEVGKLEQKHEENPAGRYFVPLANAYRRLGDVARAEALLREGLHRHPEYLSAHIVLGRCLADRGAVGEAADEYRYVLSLDPQNLIALRSLGDLALRQGDRREAERWYRELLGVDPLNEEARRALESLEVRGVAVEPQQAPPPAGAYPVRGTPQAEVPAEETVEEAVREFADEAVGGELITETIAELYARQGLFQRSADVYRELVRRRGGDPALQRRLQEVERLAAGEAGAAPVEPTGRDEPAALPGDPEPRDTVYAEPEPAVPFSQNHPEEIPAGYADTPADEPIEEPVTAWESWGGAADDEPAVAEGGETAGAEPEPATIGQYLRALTAWSPERAGGTEAGVPVAAAVPSVTEPEPAPETSGGTGPAGGDLASWEQSFPAGAAGPSAGPEREQLFSYEEYLSGGEPAPPEPRAAEPEPAPAPRQPAPPPASTTEEDDLESFQAWLRSLKR